MFGWLRPKPPLNSLEKAWTETRLRSLIDHVGRDVWLRTRMVLPNRELLAEASSLQGDAPRLAAMLRGYFPVPLQSSSLPSPASCSTAGDAGCGNCGCDSSHSKSPDTEEDIQITIADTVRELCRKALAEQQCSASSDDDRTVMADLASVVAGFGIFSANASLRRGTLPVRVWGYALALQAGARDDAVEEWKPYLREDPMLQFTAAWRYLSRNGESRVMRQQLDSPRGARSLDTIVGQLREGSASQKIAAIWELAGLGSDSAPALAELLGCSHDRDVHVRAESLGAIGAIGEVSHEAMERLGDGLHDLHESVRAASASSLGRLGTPPADLLHDLAEAVCDSSLVVSGRAVEAVARIGPSADVALPALLRNLRGALVACSDERAVKVFQAIQAIVPDARARVLDYLDESDHDLRHAALDLLEHLDAHSGTQAESA
jgi:hypothetical protein